jgi:hypothetical protein
MRHEPDLDKTKSIFARHIETGSITRETGSRKEQEALVMDFICGDSKCRRNLSLVALDLDTRSIPCVSETSATQDFFSR